MSLQNALNKLFNALGEVFRVPSASAYCQAKKKVKPEVFVHLSQVLCEDFYTLYGADQEVRLWHGHRLLGADGTYLTLPDTAELRACFSVHENQHVQEQHKQVPALAMKERREVIIRCPRQSFSVVNELWESAEGERIVLLRVAQRAATRKACQRERFAGRSNGAIAEVSTCVRRRRGFIDHLM